MAFLLAFQHTADALAEHIHVERLGDVIVGTHAQPLQFVGCQCLCGEQDDGNMREIDVALDAAAKFQTVHPIHHHVGDDDVGLLLFQQLQGLLSVGGFHDAVLLAQGGSHIGEQVAVVFYEQ